MALMLFALAGCFGEENHVYTSPCDPSCNECGRVTREPEEAHTFADCGDTECDVCGEIREAAEHTYKSACDATCEVCSFVRTEFQPCTFDSPCDADCNLCGAEREASEHIYTNDCDTDCNFCGAERVTNHVYSNDCDKTCNVCGALRIPGAHTYSNDCDSTCDICGELRMVPNHVYSTACDADCNVCGELRIAANHTYDHACDADCNLCGATRVVADHVYDNACDPDCNTCKTVRENIHDFSEWKTKTAATCDQAEVIARSCAFCGVEETVDGAPALGHIFDHDCDTACNRAKCNYKRTIEHTYTEEYVTLIPATCTSAEVLHRFCDICDYEDKETGKAALGHDYDNTCDTTCNREDCDYVRVITHTFGDWATKTDATCIVAEVEHRICSVCEAEETRIGDVAALGHDYDHDCDTTCNREGCGYTRVTEHVYDDNCDADCNVEGCGAKRVPPHTYDSETDLECNDCTHKRDCTGHLASDADCTICWVCGAQIDGAMHDFDEWATKTAATCFAAEVEYHGCKNCEVEETRTGDPMREHKYSFECDTVCDYEDCGYTRTNVEHLYDNACDEVCNREGCNVSREVTHFFGDWATKTEATCTEDEVEHRICAECKAEETQAGDVKALEHEFIKCDAICSRPGCGETREVTHDYAWEQLTAATCTDAEVLKQVCSICGETGPETAEGEDALGHKYTDECDAVCDRENCGFERTPPHVFKDEHDVTCENCDYVRECNGHKALSTDCTVCEYCGKPIPNSAHTYANLCDTDCDVCGAVREVEPHRPMTDDCTTCQYCLITIPGAAHISTKDCTKCDNCGYATGKTHTQDPNNCVVCKDCGKASGATHTPNYAENCTQCEICKKNLGTAHTDADGDGKCDKCPKETLPGANWFPWAPL